MLQQGFTWGTRLQEELLYMLAGVIHDYAVETAGPGKLNDEVIILGVVRRTMRKELPTPLRKISEEDTGLITSLFDRCINDLVIYFDLHTHHDAIMETCLVIYEEWRKRLAA